METQMSDQNERRLTINDPVPGDVIQQFRQIREAQSDIGLNLLALERQKIALLAGAKKLDEQHSRMFQALLVERGVEPTTPAELDATTGKLVLMKDRSAPEPPQPS